MFHREAALLAASGTPLFRERRTLTTRERYPNVYDCYAEAKQAPAFVGGAKVEQTIYYSDLTMSFFRL